MNNKFKFFGITLLVILAVVVVGAGVAFAQTPTPTGYGPGWMMGGDAQYGPGYSRMGGRGGMMNGYARGDESWEWMESMHSWMSTSGSMHTFVWDALAKSLGLTSDELYAEVNSGKTLTQVGEEKGVSRADLLAALESAHKDNLAQAVTDGYITQEQADRILTQMSGRYEWMLDSAGYGMMGGAYGPQGAGGNFGPGACHGNWDDSAGSQP